MKQLSQGQNFWFLFEKLIHIPRGAFNFTFEKLAYLCFEKTVLGRFFFFSSHSNGFCK